MFWLTLSESIQIPYVIAEGSVCECSLLSAARGPFIQNIWRWPDLGHECRNMRIGIIEGEVMAINIAPEVIATGVGILSAVTGYGFREYRNRIRPFFQVTRIDGEVTKNTDETIIDEEVVASLENSFYMKKIASKTRVRDALDKYKKAAQIKANWPEIEMLVGDVLSADDDASLIEALSRAFSNGAFERFVMVLLVTDRLVCPSASTDAQERITVYDSEERNGSVWLSFPANVQNFGNMFKDPAMRAKCAPLIDNVRFLCRDNLRRVFERFSRILEAENRIAVEVFPRLQVGINQHSRWALYCYFANLSHNPLIIEKDACLTVVQKGQVKISEPCYVTILKLDEDGDQYIADTQTPLTVRSESDVEFCLVTNKTQGEMNLGGVMRDVYDKGGGKCYLTVTVRRVGLFKRQRLRTTVCDFCASSEV